MNPSYLSFYHGMIDGGLLYLNHYLEQSCGCNVCHIGPYGRLIYDGAEEAQCNRLKQKLCGKPIDGEFSYAAEFQCMVYQFSIRETNQQLLFFPVDAEDCLRILRELNQIALPLLYYLRGLNSSFAQYRILQDNDASRIFTEDRRYWEDLLNAWKIDADSPVNVVVIDTSSQKENLSQIFQLVGDLTLRDGCVDAISYQHHDRIILLLPGRYHLKAKADAVAGIDLDKQWQTLKKQFGKGITIAVSDTVTYQTMLQGYRQALAAIFYLDYFRKDTRLIFWNELGSAKHPIEAIRLDEEAAWLQKLNRYENERSGHLLSTLRELVRCQFNYQATAGILHIHLNTLYYRQDKLSDMLELDFTELETKILFYEQMLSLDFSLFFQKEMQTP